MLFYETPAKKIVSMEITSQFIDTTSSTDANRKGGILLKGRTRSSRQPVHMMMLVDTSGSMDEAGKLDSVKKSLQVMLVLLSEEDRLSLVTFDDRSKVVLNRITPTATDREAISYRISALHTDGSTNMSSGLLEIRQLIEDQAAGRKQGILLLTDGIANMGITGVNGLVNIVQRIVQEKPGVSVSTVGYGADHNTELLTEIAKEGGGAYNVVKSLEDVASTFGDVLGGLMSISVQGAVLEFPPGYKVTTSYPVTKEASGFTRVNIGDIYSDTEITVMFEGNPTLGPIRVLGTDMTNLDPIDALSAPEMISSEETVLTSFIVAQFRKEVTDMLIAVRNSHPSASASKIEDLMQRIREHPRLNGHPITPFLLEDLQQVLNIRSMDRHITHEEYTDIAQHSAYIGMNRGLRSTTSQAPSLGPPRPRIQRQRAVGAMASLDPDSQEMLAPGSPPQTPPPVAGAAIPPMPEEPPSLFASPTANAVQRQMLSVMRTMSLQP